MPGRGAKLTQPRSFPVYDNMFYIGKPDTKQYGFQYIDTAYWTIQLETSYRDADGIVLWGPSRFSWDEASGWSAATLDFISQVA
jgi:hypothetical protein